MAEQGSVHERARNRSRTESVYDSLRQALRSGVYRAGDRLREDEVAKRLDVSRTPVREALGRLVEKRLLEPAGGRGLVVRRLATPEVHELYVMREILEGAAAHLAAKYISATEMAILRDNLEATRAATAPESLAALNANFHRTIVGAAHNRYLQSALEELQDTIALLGGTTFSVRGRKKEVLAEHEAIVAALDASDQEAAEAAAAAHIRNALRARLKMLAS